MFVQSNKSSDESRVSKKDRHKELDNSEFEQYARQCKIKPYPEPRGPLASEVALDGSLPDTEPAIQRKASTKTLQLGGFKNGIKRITEKVKDAFVTSSLVFVNSVVDKKGSFALVTAKAKLTDRRQRVEYYIMWDANCVPLGTHLGQKPATESPGWVLDKSQKGFGIGDRKNPEAAYYSDKGHEERNPEGGHHFYFDDGIEMPKVFYPHGSSWKFRLKVFGINNALLQDHIVTVPW